MNPALTYLLQRKQKLAEEINRLAWEQRALTLEIRDLERAEKKDEDTTGGARIDTGNLNERNV